MIKNLDQKILLSITGKTKKEFYNKMDEVEKLGLKRVALFLECYQKKSFRQEIYDRLLKSSIKDIPLVHIRNEMTKDELEFLEKNYKTKCFTIHELSFEYIKKWKGYFDKLFLELNYDNHVRKYVDVNKIGGFCVDLSHFKTAEVRNTKEFYYEIKRKNIHRYFKCNHLNGYSWIRKKDLHNVKKLSEFKYLKTLPDFVFGKYIAIETFNPIKDQIKFKNHIIKLLSK